MHAAVKCQLCMHMLCWHLVGGTRIVVLICKAINLCRKLLHSNASSCDDKHVGDVGVCWLHSWAYQNIYTCIRTDIGYGYCTVPCLLRLWSKRKCMGIKLGCKCTANTQRDRRFQIVLPSPCQLGGVRIHKMQYMHTYICGHKHMHTWIHIPTCIT